MAGGKENLKVPTSDEARRNGRKGGKASGEARRRKKELRECLELLLEQEITDRKGTKKTGAEALSATLFKKALSADVRAFEVLRDTAGQKPVERVQLAEIDAGVIEEVESIFNE